MIARPPLHFARLWLQRDDDPALLTSAGKPAPGSLAGQTPSAYRAAPRRADTENPDTFTKTETLLGTGMLLPTPALPANGGGRKGEGGGSSSPPWRCWRLRAHDPRTTSG